MEALITKLGEEVQDVDEETFHVFSQSFPSQDLGIIDPRASLELTVGGRDFYIAQSPGILQSTRGGGTTGAVVWQTSVRFAEWIVRPGNPLFEHGCLTVASTVLELGAGISGLLPSLLSSKISKFVATDQSYILKALRENVEANSQRSRPQRNKGAQRDLDNIAMFSLDWEDDDVRSVLSSNGLSGGVDVVVACDCVFNYALIDPFVQTCVDICTLRTPNDSEQQQCPPSTICVVAQQLRQAEVFEQWLRSFHQRFRVWRVSSDLLSEGLGETSGFIVHVGVLRTV